MAQVDVHGRVGTGKAARDAVERRWSHFVGCGFSIAGERPAEGKVGALQKTP